jgi:hypothetical protein
MYVTCGTEFFHMIVNQAKWIFEVLFGMNGTCYLAPFAVHLS